MCSESKQVNLASSAAVDPTHCCRNHEQYRRGGEGRDGRREGPATATIAVDYDQSRM